MVVVLFSASALEPPNMEVFPFAVSSKLSNGCLRCERKTSLVTVTRPGVQDPERVREITYGMIRRVSRTPVTVKCRIGVDDNDS